MKTAYVLVSPCKDEGRYIESTLRSIARQTVPPAQWIIVDDGSTDDGMAIVARWREAMPFIKVVTRGAAARQVGPGVIRAFNAGLAAVDVDYDFVCKLDVDLELPERYFEVMLARMDDDPSLGTCSGKAYYLDAAGAPRSELCGDEASVGMIKFYRRAAFEAIGGFETEVGWDGYDCHRARWLGWRARSWDDPEIRFLHLRPMGSSQKSIYAGRVRHGRGQYLIGAHPLFFLAEHRLPQPAAAALPARQPLRALRLRARRRWRGSRASATARWCASCTATSSGRSAAASGRRRNGRSRSAGGGWRLRRRRPSAAAGSRRASRRAPPRPRPSGRRRRRGRARPVSRAMRAPPTSATRATSGAGTAPPAAARPAGAGGSASPWP